MKRTYKPWKSKVNEEMGAKRRVSGTTAQTMGHENGVLPAEHSHAFEIRVVAGEDGVDMVQGETSSTDGHTHAISGWSETDPAPDGHYHLLPSEANGEYPNSGDAAKAESLNFAALLDGDDKALGEWLATQLSKAPAKKSGK